MKLSFSVRVAEAPGSKEETIRSFDEIAALADQLGYNAVCMRASQAGIQTPLQQITTIRQKTRQLNLGVSMVTGDFPIPINNDQGPDALRNITPYLDLTDLLGANLIRIAMKKRKISSGRNEHPTKLASEVSGWHISRIRAACLKRWMVQLIYLSGWGDITSASSTSQQI